MDIEKSNDTITITSNVTVITYYFKSTQFYAILITQTALLFCLSIFAAFFNSILIKLLVKTNAQRKNVTFLLVHLSISISIHVFYLLGHCLYNVFYMINPSKNQRYPYCDVFESLNTIAIASTVLIMFQLALEQVVVTAQMVKRNAQWYTEHLSKWIGFSPIFVWFLCALQAIPMFLESLINSEFYYCHSVFILTVTVVCTLEGVLLMLEFLSCVLFLWVFTKSQNQLKKFGINTVQHSLNERFHLFQMVAANRALFPSSLVQIVCYSLTFVFQIMLKYQPNPDISIYILNLNLIIFCVFHVAHSVLVIKLNPPLLKLFLQRRRHLMNIVGLARKDSKVNPLVQKGIVDFRQNPIANVEMLETFWTTNIHTRRSISCDGIEGLKK